jgi:hypothetical protein
VIWSDGTVSVRSTTARRTIPVCLAD